MQHASIASSSSIDLVIQLNMKGTLYLAQMKQMLLPFPGFILRSCEVAGHAYCSLNHNYIGFGYFTLEDFAFTHPKTLYRWMSSLSAASQFSD